jgi:hypothetical protein
MAQAQLTKLAVALAALSLLAACGEKGDVTTYKQGKYQGKADAKPYESAPNAFSNGSKWTAGDKASWETAIKARQQSQNEYNRAE